MKMSRYYEALYTAAVEEDRRAMPQALKLGVLGVPLDQQSFGQDFWDNIRPDQRMDIARGIAVELDSWFSEQLKELLVRKRISIYGFNREGQRIRIDDPDVIDFDDAQVSEAQFMGLLAHY